MKILGIDFGLSKMGLAISEEGLSRPLSVIETKKWPKELVALCQKEKVEKIVVGLSTGKMAPRQQSFARKLASLTGLPVVFEDETLTTHEAFVRMNWLKKKKGKEDAFAAAVILEAYLEKENV